MNVLWKLLQTLCLEAYRKHECKALRFLGLGTRWRWVASAILRPEGRVHGLSESRSRSGRGGDTTLVQPPAVTMLPLSELYLIQGYWFSHDSWHAKGPYLVLMEKQCSLMDSVRIGIKGMLLLRNWLRLGSFASFSGDDEHLSSVARNSKFESIYISRKISCLYISNVCKVRDFFIANLQSTP
jgi:hypothetical protein